MKINKLFDYADFSDPDFIKTSEEFGDIGDASFSVGKRKSWEFTIMSYGLEQLGCFLDTAVALGTGCLKENLIYYYANRFGHVHATDVAYYPKEDPRLQLWGTEHYSVEEVYESNIPYDKSKLTVTPMDMLKLEFPDEMFDVVWCSSSIEHTGTLAEVLASFVEVQRVLKPGGIFTITTEWNLDGSNNSRGVKFANVQSFDNYVMDRIKDATPSLTLVEPLSLERGGHPKNLEKEYMLGKTNKFYGDVIDYTSVSLFWRKVEDK